MSDPSPTKSPFPAGFERDAKTLLLAYDMKAIPLYTLQHNLRRLGVEFPDEGRVLPAPMLERPTLEPEPEFAVFDEDHVFDVNTGAVFNVHTREHVGWLQPEDEEPEAELLLEAGEDEPIGPPPEGAEFEDDGVVPRPNPDDDEQVDEPA